MSSDEWTVFADALGNELRRLELNSTIVLFNPQHDDHMCQFWQTADHLRAETTPATTPPAQQLLRAAGWQPPDEGEVNWHRRMPWPATTTEYTEMTNAAVTALRDVHHTPAPSALVYQSWMWATNDPRTLHLPTIRPA